MTKIKMNNKRDIFLIALLIVISVFLILYPLKFDLYECVKAKRIIDMLALPLSILALVYFIYRKFKSGDYIIWRSMLKTLLMCGIVYFFIVRSLFGCGITFINSIFGRNEVVKIKGVVTGKIQRKGGYKSVGLYELTILEQGGREIILDTKLDIIRNYSTNDRIEIVMKKGLLNLLYK
jgi:hypothetical protein